MRGVSVRRYAIALALLFLVQTAVSQHLPFTRISYRLAMSRPASHLFEVTIDVETAPGRAEDHIDFQIPRWQPGRYAIADFAKNVQEFRAASADRNLGFTRIDD